MIRYIKTFISRVFAKVINLLPPSTRAKALMRLINPSVQYDTPENALRFLFELDNSLYSLQGKSAVRFGEGIHSKHKQINYHQFFIKNIKPGERVLDIGSGNGFLVYDMAQVEGVQVVGIELSETKVSFARDHYKHPNLRFIQGDVLKDLPNETFDIVILSNVLEHIEHRVEFLRKVLRQIVPKRLIIRVPVFERDWRVPLKKELGMDYRLDKTHCIEYQQEDFFKELRQAGLKTTHVEFRWGEIWSMVEPLSSKESND